VVLTEHITDDTRISCTQIGTDAHVVHGIQDAALHGL
jgi:hypothetical protein